MTIACILAVISAVNLLLFLSPYVIYPLSLRDVGRKPVNVAHVDLSASLLSLCAINETVAPPAKIRNLRKLNRAWPRLRTLSYNDNSTNRPSSFFLSSETCLSWCDDLAAPAMLAA